MKNKNFFKINLIYFTAMTCVALIFVLGYNGVIKSDVLSSFLIQILVMCAIPLLMYTLLISKNAKQTFKDAGFKKITKKMLAITVALGFVLYFINSFVADAFSSIITLLGYENLYGATTVKLTYKLLLKDLILSAVLPAICEEILHRGIMIFTNKKINSPRYCLIVSSLLFGLMHLNINQFFYAAILGCLMGYVALCADSIFPTMIIHFMNNFLSSYFFYGYYLNWPLARFVGNTTQLLGSNIVLFVAVTCCGIFLLFSSYRILTKMLVRERAKCEVQKILFDIQTGSASLEETQARIALANQLLAKTESGVLAGKSKEKSSFLDKAFLYSAFFLGGLITILTFVWGII